MKISVIVSTYNSTDWLQKVLWGFERQSDTNFELLIADDGSSPENKAINQDLASAMSVPCQHIWHEDDGFRKCEILNKAIMVSHGEYLIFTDGDCIPSRTFVATHRAFAKPGFFLSGGYSKLPRRLSERISQSDIKSGRCFSPFWLTKNGLKSVSSLLKISASRFRIDGILNVVTPAKRTFNGNNSSCYRKDALAVNGFDQRMRYGGEDREFGYRLENLGITPKGIRYSAPCLHLDHARGYVDPDLRAMNLTIIDETKTKNAIQTRHGLLDNSQ